MKTGEDKSKKEERSGNISKVVGSLVAGAAVGLAAGILLAPDKGKKTRAKLLEDAKDLTNKLKETTNDFREKAKGHMEKKADDLKEKANNLKAKADDKIDSIVDKA